MGTTEKFTLPWREKKNIWGLLLKPKEGALSASKAYLDVAVEPGPGQGGVLCPIVGVVAGPVVAGLHHINNS